MRTCKRCGEPLRRGKVFCSSRCANTVNARRGADHASYNGGLTFNKTLERWQIICRDGTAMYFYRGVMAAYIGRLLLPTELVHHLNGDQTDDRIENLEIVGRSEHARMHDFGSLGRRGPMGARA